MTDYEQARDLMRRLVEVANSDGGDWFAGMGENFGIEEAQVFGASLCNYASSDFYQENSEESFSSAVRSLIAKTPWAGRVL